MKTLIEYWADLYNQQVFGESYLAEDKTAMIKKLALPDIEDTDEKEKFKSKLIDFFKSHSNYENKIDWNKSRTLTKKDFNDLIQSAENSKSVQKKQIRSEIESDIKNIFKSVGNRKFKIVGENDRWLFVAPLTYEAAVYCDSSENQGAGAKWCIGYKDEDGFWYDYIKDQDQSVFIMAFNKNYKNLSSKDKQSKLKFMIQRDKNEKYHVWNQRDKDTGSNLDVFGDYKKIADEMFETAKKELWEKQGLKEIKIGNKKIIISNNNNDINCSNNELTSLEGAPSKVGGDFICSHNQLTSLEGAPSEVGGTFNCGNNKLTSLKGCPSKIRWGFYCWSNKLTSLKGAPAEVGGDFYCSDNPLTKKQITAYEKFLKMTPKQQKASGLLDDTGHYDPKE